MMTLRRAAALTVGLVLLSGCTAVDGVDGDLLDDWPAVAAPTPFTPIRGACHLAGHKNSNTETLASYHPVDCAQEHGAETVYVGRFTGEVADRSTPPADGSVAHRAAYAVCDKQASAYVGDEWREGHLVLGVVMPSSWGWRGGARWFRCDLTVEDSHPDVVAQPLAHGEGNRRVRSLFGALRGASPLRLGCYRYNEADSSRPAITPAACNKPHNFEFVGVYTAPDTLYPEGTSAWNRLHEGCRRVIAAYVNVPYDRNIGRRSGVFGQPDPEPDWAAGNRGVRCYVWLPNRTMSRSLKGAGPDALPF